MWCRHTRAGKEIYAHKRTYTYSHIYEGGWERTNTYIRWFITNLQETPWVDAKGIKSYLCLVQTGHVDIEEFRCGKKGESRTFQTKELSIIEYGKLLFPKPPRSNDKGQFFCLKCMVSYYGYTCLHNLHRNIIFHLMTS